MPPKGEYEVIYVPSKGLDFSRPYNTIDKEYLAPGSVNTQAINGFLCSSPWVGTSPFSTTFAAGEIVLGQFVINNTVAVTGESIPQSLILIVTNIAVYIGDFSTVLLANPTAQPQLQTVHTWAGGEVNNTFMSAGNTVAFLEVQTGPPSVITSVYFTGLMFNGVFHVVANGTFSTATTYVCGRYIAELGGRIVLAQTRFPTGGGPFGNVVSATVAWSGVGSFDGSGVTDPWNPANFATLNGNVGGFNLLSDTPDQLTGIATMGRSGMLARTHGFTSMDPGPSGIDPWLFYHLWSSPQGAGAYNETFQQYGQLVMFLADDNVYIMSLSGGLQNVGDKIISKIKADLRQAGFKGIFGANPISGAGEQSTAWYLASFAVIGGQLHYLLSFNAYVGNLPTSIKPYTATCLVYDYNVVEGAWHIWDLSQYYKQSVLGSGFLFFSSPILDASEVIGRQANFGGQTDPLAVTLQFLLFGAITSPRTTVPLVNANGQMFQFVALDYDVNTNPFTAYWANLYTPLSMPATTVKFRGENVGLGHTVAQRRLRIQSMNAPFPTTVASYQGQVNVTFQGSQQGSQTTPIPVNLGVPAVIENDYGDVRLADQMVQATINVVITGGTPWRNLPLLRLATVSLIGMDPRGTTP
jgi:hypothetical protein